MGAQAPPAPGARVLQGVGGVHPAGALAHPPHRPRRRRPRRRPRHAPPRLRRRPRPLAGLPQGTDSQMRPWEHREGRGRQAFPRGGVARAAEAAHLASSEVSAGVARGCCQGSGICITARNNRMPFKSKPRYNRAASCWCYRDSEWWEIISCGKRTEASVNQGYFRQNARGYVLNQGPSVQHWQYQWT